MAEFPRNTAEFPRNSLELFLPEDNPEVDFVEFYARFNTLAVPLAFFVSYSRNQDVKWAVIHAIFAAPYLAYILVESTNGSRSKSRSTIRSTPEA